MRVKWTPAPVMHRLAKWLGRSRRAPYASQPEESRGRLHPEPEQRDALAVSARPRPHHPFDRVPPAQAQDPGLRLSRGRPLPHAADPQPRSGADRAHRSAARSASTRIWPRRWRWRTTSATPRSAMPARRRSTPRWRPYGGFSHNDQTLRILTRLEHGYAEFDGLNLTWETLEGTVKHNGPLGRHRAPLPPSIAEYDRAPHARPRHITPGPRRRSPRSPTTSPTTTTTSTTGCAPGCSRSPTSPTCRWSARCSPRSPRAIPGSTSRG